MRHKFLPFFACLALAALLPSVGSAQSTTAQGDAVAYSRYFAQGVENFDAGCYEEALDSFLRAVQANPQDAAAVFNAGLVYERMGKHTEAAAAFRMALELRPTYPKAQRHLCTALLAAESFREAVEACGRAIRVERQDAALYYQYGRAFEGEGLFDQAVKAYRLSTSLSPADAEVHLRLGLAYYRLGEFRDALDSLERASRLAPDSTEAKEAYKRVAAEIEGLDSELGYVEGSVKSYERCLSLGDAYRLKGWYAKALAVYKRAIKAKPADARGYYLEGLAYYGANQYYRAADAYEQALRLEPANGEAKKSLAWLQAYLRNRNAALPVAENAAGGQK